jgi:hypothetical protein
MSAGIQYYSRSAMASPAAGAYDSAPSITLECAAEGATIYYTIDESDPANGTIYNGAFTLSPFPGTLKAIAVKEGMKPSGIFMVVYTKTDTQNPAPAFGPGVYAGGSYYDGNYKHAGYWAMEPGTPLRHRMEQ